MRRSDLNRENLKLRSIGARNRKKAVVATTSIILAAALLLNSHSNEPAESAERRPRRWWVRPWLNQNRGNISLPEEFSNSDQETYKNYLRMDERTFDKLLEMIKHRITEHSTIRQTISARSKLIITLRYLATGESFRSLMYNYRISESTISIFIPIVCNAIYQELQNVYLKVPNTAAEWLEIAREFMTAWQAPNVIGAMVGKHITIKTPTKQGSVYFNYKHQHSIILLAMVDAKYKFTYINVGMNGRLSDGGVYGESDFSGAIERNLLNIPEDIPLPGRTEPVPHVIVADAAFGLSTSILKPYPFRNMDREQRIFNYRLSRARRVVENAFGILANRFRVLLNVIPLSPKKARIITKACCVLHNFLKEELSSNYLDANVEAAADGQHKFLFGLSRKNLGRPRTEALNIREEFKAYFNRPGSVPWQNDRI